MRSLVVLLSSAAVVAHAAPITVTVGTDFATVSAAAAAADADTSNTYTILLPSGTYTNDFAFVSTPMTIAASGGPVTLLASGQLLQDKGIIVTTSSLTVKGLTFQGAAISDQLGGNGAGIRDQSTSATTLRVENSSFVGNQDGILTAGSNFQEKVEIVGSTFLDNGSGTGQTHALYVGDALSLLVQNSLFCGTNEGHDIKSRAMSTTVTGSHVYDGATGPGCASAGTTSYGIEATNGGTMVIADTDLIQGPGTHNSTMLRYGADGLYPGSTLSIANTNFTSTSGGTGIQSSAATGCTLTNTTFTGLGTNVDPAGFCTQVSVPPGPTPVNEPNIGWLLMTACLGWAGYIVIQHPRERQDETT